MHYKRRYISLLCILFYNICYTCDRKSSMISKSFSCKIPSKHAFMSVLTKYKWFLKNKTHKNKPFHNRCQFSTTGFINTAINYKTFLDLFSSLKQTLSSLRRCHQFQIWQLQSKMDHMTKIQHFGVYNI